MSRKIYPGESESVRARSNRLKAAGICWLCGQRPSKHPKGKCLECWNKEQAHTKRWRQQLMREVILKYGGKCYYCGETIFEFLTLDHINNDGHKERKERGYRGGYAFYKTLRDIPVRSDLRVACYNCNLGRTRSTGICPHTVSGDI